MKRKNLLIHSCCAPCFIGAEKKLLDYEATIFWFNPNIDSREEERKRRDQFSKISPSFQIIDEDDYETENKLWNEYVKEYAAEKEGGNRCALCFEYRLMKTAKKAKKIGIPLFTTTLSVSPHKNSEVIGKIGKQIGLELDIEYLSEDFKKNDGYLHSINLSKKLGLYRQKYCGCKYSKGS